jgi:glyoxylase-like metal-dependent hydrolase (beta-lactamase superfamily II)
MDTIKEIIPGIFKITEESNLLTAIKPPVNIFIIAGPDGLVFESGYGNRKNINYFSRCFKQIEKRYQNQGEKFQINRILISHAHPDHFSGLKKIKRHFGFSITLTKRMAAIIKNRKEFRKYYWFDFFKAGFINKGPIQIILARFIMRIFIYFFEFLCGMDFVSSPDMIIEDKSKLLINNEEWEIFPSPGHTDDHISLYNREKKILFSGDNVITNNIPWLGPPGSNLSQYFQTLTQLQSLDNLKIISGSHGDASQDPYYWIILIKRWREKRVQDVLTIIKNAGSTGISQLEMITKLYPEKINIVQLISKGWILLTLNYLEEKELIKQFRNSAENKYYAIGSTNI